MVHEVVSGDGGEVGLHLKPRQVGGHRDVQVKPALVPKLQKGHVGKGLPDGTNLKHGVGPDRPGGRQISVPEGCQPEQLLPVSDCQRQPRHIDLTHPALKVLVNGLEGAFKARHILPLSALQILLPWSCRKPSLQQPNTPGRVRFCQNRWPVPGMHVVGNQLPGHGPAPETRGGQPADDVQVVNLGYAADDGFAVH